MRSYEVRSRKIACIAFLFASLLLPCEDAFSQADIDPPPFAEELFVDHNGTVIVRPSIDRLRGIMYDTDTTPPTRRMWWLGDYQTGEGDLAPYDFTAANGETVPFHPTDRIYYSESADGLNWSSPQVVLKGRGCDGGENHFDDLLVGSPSVLKVDGTFYMYYEAYGYWYTVVNRFHSHARNDDWVIGGYRPREVFSTGFDGASSVSDWARCAYDPTVQGSGNTHQVLGFAPMFPKAGTHPVYSYEAISGDRYNLG